MEENKWFHSGGPRGPSYEVQLRISEIHGGSGDQLPSFESIN